MDHFRYSLASSFGLRVVPVEGDGNCLFRSVATALAHSGDDNVTHAIVRNRVVNFLRAFKDSFRVDDAHIDRMAMHGVWGGEVELTAIANMYNRSVEVYMFDPTGRAVHARTYTPAHGIEIAIPIRMSLLPFSGRLNDAPNHYSFLQKIAVDLGARATAGMPAPPAAAVEIIDDDYIEELPAAPAVPAVVPAAPAVDAAKKPSYYRVYDALLVRGMRTVTADLAAKAEVAWYACSCGGSCRRAATGADAWRVVVKSAEPVEPVCKLWKPWRTYHDARAHGTISDNE